jgi:hypothetical protein
MAIAAGAAFVGRGVSWERNELAALLTKAINTRGFSLVDVFSPCVTYHREPGFRGPGPIVDWYKNNYVLDIKDAWGSMRNQVFTEDERATLPVDYDPTSQDAALNGLRLIAEAAKLGREVTGLLLHDESQATMADNAGISADSAPALLDISLAPNLGSYRELLAEMR